MATICQCCGQPIRAKAAKKPRGKTYKGYDDFVPDYNAARHAIAADLGSHWHLIPEASVWARVPSAWVACKVFGRTSSAPRDMRLPAAKYWPGGAMPVGPEYAEAQVITPEVIEHWRTKAMQLVESHRRGMANLRDLRECVPSSTVAISLQHAAARRREAAAFLRRARLAEAA